MSHYQKYNPALTPNARKLRKEMTPQERQLWYDFLRDYPLRFLRQKVILSYIADFYCAKAKLIIELDGSHHYTEDVKAHDAARTKIMEMYGISVIRFSNRDMDTNFEGVCNVIDLTVKGGQ